MHSTTIFRLDLEQLINLNLGAPETFLLEHIFSELSPELNDLAFNILELRSHQPLLIINHFAHFIHLVLSFSDAPLALVFGATTLIFALCQQRVDYLLGIVDFKFKHFN